LIDDVNLFIGKNPGISDKRILCHCPKNINRWHGILKATSTRGELNTKKCF